jgi:hypothetical protein
VIVDAVHQAALQRLGGLPATNLGPVGGGGDHERRKAPIQSNPAAVILLRSWRVVTVLVQVGGVDVEAHIPAVPVPATRGEQDPGAWYGYRLSGVGVELLEGAEQPPQPAGVVVHADHAEARQRHRPGMSLTH